MANDKDVRLELIVDAQKAIAALSKFEKDAKAPLKGAEDQFKSLKSAALEIGGTFAAVFAAKKIFDFFASGVEGAAAQQKALAVLSAQLKNTGDYSSAAVDDFKAFADQMEDTTQFGDEVVISQLAVAKSFGATNEQAKDLVKAASELSAVTGDDLASSVTKLGKTLSGDVGRELSKTVAGMSSLTAESLKAGAGIQFVLDNFGGSQAAVLETFSGSTTQLEHSFENLAKAFGQTVVTNPAVVAAIQTVTTVFRGATDIVSDNSDALRDFIGLLAKGFVTGVSLAVEAVGFLSRGMEGFVTVGGLALGTIAQIAAGMALFTPISDDAVASIAEFSDSIVEKTAAASVKFENFNLDFKKFQGSVDEAATKVFAADTKIAKSADDVKQGRHRAFEQSAKDMEKFAKEAEDLENKLRGHSGNEFDKTIEAAQQYYAKINELRKEGAIGDQRAADLRVLVEQDMHEKLQKLTDDYNAKDLEAAKKHADEIRSAVEAAGSDPAKFAIGKADISPLGLDGDTSTGIAAGIGGATLALQGKAGAQKAVSGLAGAAADALIPGIGAVVGPFVDALSQGPEQAKAMIKGFVEGIPDIVKAISESIPVVVDTLVEYFIKKNGAVKIAIAIATGLADAAAGIIKDLGSDLFGDIDFGNLGQSIGGGIISGAKKLFDIDKAIRLALLKGAEYLFKGIVEGAKKLFDFDKQIRISLLNAGKSLLQGIVQGAERLFDFDKHIRVALLEGGQHLFQGIVSGAQRLFQFDGMLRAAAASAAEALFSAIGNAFTGAISSLGEGLTGIFGSLKWPALEEPGWLQRLTDGIKDLLNGPKWLHTFTNAIEDLLNFNIGDLFGGGGGGGFFGQVEGAVSGAIGGLTGHARGLTEVPAGYANDSYLTKLSTGERVVDADTNGDLKAYLAEARAASAASAGAPVLVQLKLDSRVLSQAMLDLSRRNARTA